MLKNRTTKLMCLLIAFVWTTILIGSSYAYFIDSVEVTGNVIASGNLKAGLEYADTWNGENTNWKNAESTAIFDGSIRWEPNYTAVKYVRIQNKGNLAFQYRLNVVPVAPTPLMDVIDVYYGEVSEGITKANYKTLLTKVGNLKDLMDAHSSTYGILLPTSTTATMSLPAGANVDTGSVTSCIVLHMQETAGNEYQGMSAGHGFNVQLSATQYTYEMDSFGNSYDNTPSWPKLEKPAVKTVNVTPNAQGLVPYEVAFSDPETGVSAVVPAGAKMVNGATQLTLIVEPKNDSDAAVTIAKDEKLSAYNVKVEGLASDNAVPVIINMGKAMVPGLNMGNYKLYHVENGHTNQMNLATTPENHNEFSYTPSTGEVTIAMASFSEVALVEDKNPAWEGNFDYSWYTNAVALAEGETITVYTIANADQLAAFGAIVGGMDGQTQDSFKDKTINLIADVNLGDAEEKNNPDLIFYPIGYYNSNGSYDKSSGGSVTSSVSSFEGTFDGNGHTIANFYQNTWEMFGDYNDGYSGTPNHYKDAMGLFGYVNGGTVKNLTVYHFSSDGEFTPTGVIAAYADGDSTFENIAITNCNPRVYNTGNGGIIGIAGDTSAVNDDHITLKNITVDKTNKISALWGSWDVACGGLVGMYRGNVDDKGNNATGDTISFANCHVAAQIDVYNDVCANYQYYAYRYAGMMIGSVRHNTTENGKVIPNMKGISATGCTVNYGDWNDYYYCEFEKNSMASYSDDYQFSRVDKSEIIFDENGNATGCTHEHTDAEDKRAVYLPFHQLFTGYSWGVTSVGIEEFNGIKTDGVQNDVQEGDQEESVDKFKTKFTGDFLYRVGTKNAVYVGSLFAAKDGVTISNSGVVVSIAKVDKNMNVSGTFTANTTDWTTGTIQFSGTGVVKVTIQDYNFCKPTVLYLEVVDATNVTGLSGTISGNVVLLNDCGLSSLTVSGRNTVYGNGFTATYTGNGQYLNNGLKQGIITVSENGTLDNLRIKATIYPSAYLYYGKTSLGEYVQGGPSSVEGDRTRYHYQLSAVAASGNATISNCYIYGGRNNIFVNTGNVTIKDTILECGVVANVQIQSNSDHTITFEDVTTIQYQVNPTIDDTSKVMLGAGVLVGPDTTENPTIVLNGDFKQYNWVTRDDAEYVSGEVVPKIIDGALDATEYNHTINGKTASNLGIIYMNTTEAKVKDNTDLPYKLGTVSISSVNGQAYSLQGAKERQIYSDYANADRTTGNGLYEPQFKYDATLGGQYIEKTDNGDEYCYREGDTINVLFPSGDTKELDLAALVNIAKYTGQDLDLAITCKDENGNAMTVTDGKVSLSNAGKYTVTYTVTDKLFYDKNGSKIERESIEYSWDVAVSVSLKDTAIPDARFEFDATKQKMGYYKPSYGDVKQYLPFLAGLKIYDYNGKTEYLRFDGSSDFNKVASITITGYASNKASVEVKLTDGGVINTQFLARANSGGGSTYTGKIKTSNNTIYFVTDSGTSNKDTTTTAAYWYVDYYKFTGNNGVAIQSGQQTFNSTGSSASTPSGNFSTTIKYTVTYDANEGNCGQNVGYATSASAAVTLPTPTRSGYIFAGWYTAASGGTRVGGADESYTPSANITLYAQWGKPCTVTYNANGGSCGTASEKYTGTALTLPTPTRDGYWFIGWYDAATGGNKIGDAGATYNPAGEITLYAHWQEKIEYTVTYNANSGNCGTTSATYQGTALTLPTPTRTGYTFNGWYTAATGGTKIGDAGATYIPSANITLYAQWQINSYPIKVTTSNATVKVNGTTVNNNGTVSIQYGAQVTVEVTYSKSNSRSTTIKGTDGTTYTSPFTMPAQDVTINATSKDSCVTAETLVTLADGSKKEIQHVTHADQLLVWNFFTGDYDVAPAAIIFYHGDELYDVLSLKFEDGTVVKAINNHGFYDVAENNFVIIDEDNVETYIGHSFFKVDGEQYKPVKLVDYSVAKEFTGCYSIQTAQYINFMVEDMFSITEPPFDGWFDYFEIGNNLKYDEDKMKADIEKYGLYVYEEFAEFVTYEQFVAFNGPYLKVLVGRGVLTLEDILELINTYVK